MKTKGEYADSAYMPKSLPGLNAYVGAKLHDNFGAELGWTYSSHEKKKKDAGVEYKNKVTLNGGYVDALGYMPVADGVELIASVGAGVSKAKWVDRATGASDITNKGKWSFVPRVGAGVKYDINDSVGVRAIARFEANSLLRLKDDATKKSYKPFKSGVSLNVGVYAKF